MKILRDVFNRFSAPRKRAIAWLALEGWEPKVSYRSQLDHYNQNILVKENRFMEGDHVEIKDIRYIMGLITPGTWDVFTTRQLRHFVVVATYAQS